MLIKCGWCKKDMGEKPPYDGRSYTDGICDDCLLYYFPDIYEKVIAIREGNDNETRSEAVL